MVRDTYGEAQAPLLWLLRVSDKNKMQALLV